MGLSAPLLLLSTALAGETTPVRVSMDWQGHPAMHMTWRILGTGLTDREPPRTWRHQLRQSVYGPRLEASGVRLFLAAAMAAEKARTPEQARQLILDELAFVEDFVAAHPDRFAMASTPDEARDLLLHTDRMVIVHAIEGGHLLLGGPEDAAFWRAQGVALITLQHLRDDEIGGAAILPNALGPILNPLGARRERQGERRGLTARGMAALVELDAAGIVVDLAHMSPAAVDDALAVTAAHAISPVVTHGQLRALRANDFGYRDDQIVELYRQGGVFSLGLDPHHLDPIDPTLPVPADLCPSTLEIFAFHFDAVRAVVLRHAEEILGAPFDPSSPAHQARLSVGWSSDWNGFVHHAEPVYGRGRCRSLDGLVDPLPIDTLGMAHPGLLPDHWTRLARDGWTGGEAAAWSAERFLQLWADARGE